MWEKRGYQLFTKFRGVVQFYTKFNEVTSFSEENPKSYTPVVCTEGSIRNGKEMNINFMSRKFLFRPFDYDFLAKRFQML